MKKNAFKSIIVLAIVAMFGLVATNTINGCDIVVQNIPFLTTDQELRTYFKEFGMISLFMESRSIRNRLRRGIIRFADCNSAKLFLSLEHTIYGRKVKAEPFTPEDW